MFLLNSIFIDFIYGFVIHYIGWNALKKALVMRSI